MSNSLRQYLDLYDANAATVDAGSAGALNSARATARRRLEDASLPDSSSEGYQKTSVNAMFAPDFGVNIGRVAIPTDVAASFRCDVPNMSSLLAVVANDAFIPSNSLLNNLPEGVVVCSLRKAAVQYPDLVGRYYGSVAADTTQVALNTLLAQDGVFIHIPEGVRLQRPIQIVNIFSAPFSSLAFRRVLVVAEEGSAADILFCDHTQVPDTSFLASQVVEAVCLPGSSLSFFDIEESSPMTSRINSFYARQEKGSRLNVTTATLLNGVTRNEWNIDICGPDADTNLYGMAIGFDRQHIDNFSLVRHLSSHSTSRQNFRYVLDDDSLGAFEGGIEVAPGARLTSASQSNKNIIASRDARMFTSPQLLIYNDDVKCSHGSSTGQLDPAALFYMQQRGIPYSEARTMLMQAFMADVISSLEPHAVADRLRHLIDKRFTGNLASCQSCSACR